MNGKISEHLRNPFNIILLSCIIVFTIMLGWFHNVYSDVSTGLEILFFLMVGLAAFLLIIKEPILGLMLIIIFNHFDDLMELPFFSTSGRLIGVIVAIGWMVKYFFSNNTNFFKLMKLNSVLLVFIGVMVVSSLLAEYPGRSLSLSLTITLMISMVFFIQDFICNEKHMNMLIITIGLSIGIAAVVGLLQYIGTVSIGPEADQIREGARISGFQGNPNGYGALLMSGIPVLVFLSMNAQKLYVRVLSVMFLLGSIFSLFLTLSRTHILGFAFFLLCYFVLSIKHGVLKKKQIIGIAVLIIIVILGVSFFFMDLITERFQDSSEKRYDLAIKGVDLLMKNPVLGVGFGNYELMERFNAQYGYIYNKAGHDLVSILFVSTGGLGILTFAVLCFVTLNSLGVASKSLKSLKEGYLLNLSITVKSGFIALLATFFGNALIFSRVFWIYIALAVILHKWAQIKLKEHKGHNAVNVMS